MKSLLFAGRNCKELLRDPLSLMFGVGLPVVLILIISFLNQSIEGMAQIYHITYFAPGMAVFSLSFLSLFLGMLIANDRGSSYLTRLFASPLSATNYLLGYALPLFPLAVFQSTVCFAVSLFFGLRIGVNLVVTIVVLIPVTCLYVGLGLLMGSLFTPNQVGGVNSILINAAAFLSGTWFPLDRIGGSFRTLCYALPFAHSVDTVRAAIEGKYAQIIPHLLWVIVYAAAILCLSILFFRRNMKY